MSMNSHVCACRVLLFIFALSLSQTIQPAEPFDQTRPSSDASQPLPSSPRASTSLNQPDYILDAKITGITPQPATIGEVITVTASFRTADPTTVATLQAQVDVLIDGTTTKKLTEIDSAAERPRENRPTTESATPVRPTSGTREIDNVLLLVRVPEIIPPTLQTREVNISLLSRVDRRIVASTQIMVSRETSSTLASKFLATIKDNRVLFYSAATMLGAVLGIGFAYFPWKKKTLALSREVEQLRFNERSLAWSDTIDPGPLAGIDDEELLLPDDLISDLSTGQMVLFVGSHFGEIVDEPTYTEVLKLLLSSNEETHHVPLLNRALARGDTEIVEDFIAHRVSREQIINILSSIFQTGQQDTLNPLTPGKQTPLIYKALSQLPFSSILTTTWTSRLDDAFASSKPVVAFPGSASLEGIIQGSSFFILHLKGMLADSSSLLFSSDEMIRSQRDNQIYGRFLQSLLNSHPALFLGTMASEIESFLTQHDIQRSRRHHAIIPRSTLRGQSRLVAERLQEKFNINIVEYNATPGDEKLINTIYWLAQNIQKPDVPPQSIREPTRKLSSVQLSNIGPFVNLELSLSETWNIILGDNACGKSTILRSIALGLCGDAPQASAASVGLLRASAEAGFVRLRVGNEMYETTLRREFGQIHIASSGLTPLQRGRWVVLGFPPLRGVSERTRETPAQPTERASEPNVRDLLPLLSNSVDSRLDDLKQWIVHMSISSRGSTMLRSFFDVLTDLIPSPGVTLSRIDKNTLQVFVNTSDGEVTIEQVSQGMSSIVGWVGALLQRLYEIYPESPHPESEPALVLVDEIDAHLHPAWQRALVGLIEKHFKAVQIVATTHSPLVVAGMPGDSVFIARRDPLETGEVTVVQASSEVDFQGMRADQILTSPLFGLKNTRSQKDEKAIRRFSHLLGKDPQERTESETQEFNNLKSFFLKDSPPTKPAESAPPRPELTTIDISGELEFVSILEPTSDIDIESLAAADEKMEKFLKSKGGRL